MKLNECDLLDQFFSHLDDGKQTSINITKLEKAICGIEIVYVPVDKDFAEWCVTNRGVEQHRLNRINRKSFKHPIILLEWTGNTHLLVDGTHRFVKAARKGIPTLRARLVPEPIWRLFVVEDYPKVTEEFLKTSFSGIL